MAGSGWSFDSIDFQRHTKIYQNPQTELPFYYLITYPDGGLLTSIEDMSKYLSELIRGYLGKGKLLSQESYEILFKKQLSKSNFAWDNDFNYGIFIEHHGDVEIGHSGGDPGVSTFMFFDPDRKVGRLLFTNTEVDQKGEKQLFATWNILEKYLGK